jgi:hypothetical protein
MTTPATNQTPNAAPASEPVMAEAPRRCPVDGCGWYAERGERLCADHLENDAAFQCGLCEEWFPGQPGTAIVRGNNGDGSRAYDYTDEVAACGECCESARKGWL